MDKFIRDENVKLYRKALLETSDDERRRVLLALLQLLLDEQVEQAAMKRGAGWAVSEVTCECGALYRRATSDVPMSTGSSCVVCGHSLEIFSQTGAANLSLISGPIRMPAKF